MGITTTRTQQIVFATLCLFLGAFYSSASYAQTPTCTVAGHAGNFYENCASGFCEGQICNGSAFVTLSARNFSGWESVKFGNDTSTCNSARSGRLRYAGGSTWEYCNGTAWTAFGGGGGGPTYIMGAGSGQVAGTITYTSLMTVSIPANAINTTKPFRVRAYGTVLNGYGSTVSFNFRGVYGGSVIGGGNPYVGVPSAGTKALELIINLIPISTTAVSGNITALVDSQPVGSNSFENATIPATTSARNFSFEVVMGASAPAFQLNAIINRYEVEY